MTHESRMPNYASFCSLLFSLCFHASCLRLVCPCETYTNVKAAAEDYAMVILPLLVDAEGEVASTLNNTVCRVTEKPVCEENGESRSIIDMVCRRYFKLSSVSKAKSLARVIMRSLNCPCPSKQTPRGKKREGLGGEKKGSGDGGGQPGRGARGQHGGSGGAGREQGHRDTRKLCRLKVSLEGLRLCYQALASGA